MNRMHFLLGVALIFALAVAQQTTKTCADKAIAAVDTLKQNMSYSEQYWFNNQTVKFKNICATQGDKMSGSYAKCHVFKWTEDQRHRGGHIAVDNMALIGLSDCKKCQTLTMPKDKYFARECVEAVYKSLAPKTYVLDMGKKMQAMVDRFYIECQTKSPTRTWVDCSIRLFAHDTTIWQYSINLINIIIKGLEDCVKNDPAEPK